MLLNLVTYYREYRGDPAFEAYLTEKQTQRITGMWQADYHGIPIDEWNVVIDESKVVVYDAREMHDTKVHVYSADAMNYDGPPPPAPDYTPLGAPEPPKLPPCEDEKPIGERETEEAEAVDNGYQPDALPHAVKTGEVNGVYFNPFRLDGSIMQEISTKIGSKWVYGYPVNGQGLVELDFGNDYIRMSPTEARAEIAKMQRWLQAVSAALRVEVG
jgi:hypothetical protein